MIATNNTIQYTNWYLSASKQELDSYFNCEEPYWKNIVELNKIEQKPYTESDFYNKHKRQGYI